MRARLFFSSYTHGHIFRLRCKWTEWMGCIVHARARGFFFRSLNSPLSHTTV